MDCFLCEPDVRRPAETAWSWSSPRALCSSHKLPARLEDDQLLTEALERVVPEDSPLEGSVLGWIFNPVFLEGADHRRLRGWTDFAGGGMAVFEDRFDAQSYFEFRACEVARAVDLLHVLRAADKPLPTLAEIVNAATAAIEADEPDAPMRRSQRSPSAGLDDLIRAWNFERELARVRHALGRRWPLSFEDLCEWIDRCDAGDVGLDSAQEKAFVRALRDLAFRRFPAGPLTAAAPDGGRRAGGIMRRLSSGRRR